MSSVRRCVIGSLIHERVDLFMSSVRRCMIGSLIQNTCSRPAGGASAAREQNVVKLLKKNNVTPLDFSPALVSLLKELRVLESQVSSHEMCLLFRYQRLQV